MCKTEIDPKGLATVMYETNPSLLTAKENTQQSWEVHFQRDIPSVGKGSKRIISQFSLNVRRIGYQDQNQNGFFSWVIVETTIILTLIIIGIAEVMSQKLYRKQ